MAASSDEARYAKTKRNKILAWTGVIILAIFWTIVAFVPFLFMVITGFKQKLETIMYGAFHLPEKFFPDNYIKVLTDPPGRIACDSALYFRLRGLPSLKI